jgi:hypothetical protein
MTAMNVKSDLVSMKTTQLGTTRGTKISRADTTRVVLGSARGFISNPPLHYLA